MMKPNQSFKVEDLLNGKLNKDQFQIDHLPMWQMLDNLDRKLSDKGGLSAMPHEEIWKRIYEFGIIQVGLEKADFESRVENLNAQNLKWFTKATTLEAELNLLKVKYETREPVQVIVGKEGIGLSEETPTET